MVRSFRTLRIMRWYCVHPGLPLQAELRVRAAPASGSAERARVPQGRAIAACSPVFQVAGDTEDDAPVSWLQVAYQDAASGETEGGFMMASLPDGTPLLTPWETTDFRGCCEVTDPAALLFDGPQETARSLGPVQSVNLLYCVVEARGGRTRIFHPTLESAWVDSEHVHAVCCRLKHDFCSTLHTFYELNETLPEEAQIAIREFPSKEAQAVGLLSRGETLEVTVRGGNWLKIAGGSVDKAWIMWRTDALELLQEAPDVCSPNCEGIAAILDNAVADGGGHDQVSVGNQTESPSPHEVAGQITGDGASGPSSEINSSLELDAAAVAGVPGSMEEASTVVSELPATKDIQDEAEKIETNDPSQDHDSGVLANCAMSKETESGDQPIQPAKALHNEIINDAATSAITAEVEDTAAANENDPDAVANEVVEEAGLAQAAQSWDDRPIRPAPTAFDASEDADGEVPDAGVDQAALFCDDRPIRPAPVVPDVGDDDNATVEVVAEVEDAVAAEENDTDAVANEVVEEAELAQAAQSWDDRPIRPAPTAFDASVDADGEVPDAGVDQAALFCDDRPIRPAPVVPDVGDDDNATVEVVAEVEDAVAAEENDTDAVANEVVEEAELAQAAQSWDDRPIRPAPTAFDASVDADGEVPDAGVDQAALFCDDRPIRLAPVVPDVGDDDNATVEVVAEVEDAVAAEENDTDAVANEVVEEAELAQAAQSWDDRPIRPAPTAFDASVDADASTSSIATPKRSLLQRRSMLSAPSPAKAIGAPSATTRSSITGSIPKPTDVSSGLQAPRKSFGFRRPSGLAKKT
ncbi:uncharacterized protein IUM83_01447 [Phytophthora cinnamomi]|uniref:uncharacterized protein n=1 Tax=Phytophthora cinnamomi TaxID=4785 RepID=UPI003559F05E|nr:hypothetical protein IUM83_01447 [Phytophthora cinnamomi]